MSTGGSREGDGGTRPQEDAPRPPGALACTSHSTRGRGATMDMPAPHAAVVAQASDAERAGLALLAARAMPDNPMHVAAIGPDVERRVEVMRSAYVPMLAGREVLAARVGGAGGRGGRAHAVARLPYRGHRASALRPRCRPCGRGHPASAPLARRLG